MRHLEPTRPQSPRELRAFAFTVGGAFLALAALVAWRGRPFIAVVLGIAGAALALAGLAAPARLGGVHGRWMWMAERMSRVTTPVFMGVIYFGILTPLGLARRLLGRGRLGVPREASTGWIARKPDARRSDLTRQF